MTTHYIDTHCHLDSILNRLDLGGFDEFSAQHLSPDFDGCVTVSCDPDAIEPTLALAEHEKIFAAFGIHPHESRHWSAEIERKLRLATAHRHCVAYGEIGLDYHYNLSDPGMQREVFITQMQLGVELGKPLVIHTREAEKDTLDLMRAHLPVDWPIHVHCFTSSLDLAKALLGEFTRLYLGFTGIVTFKNPGGVDDVARHTPLDRLLLETDGPYLAPTPHRGKVAHPGHIPLIAAKLAQIKEIGLESIYEAARKNTREVYGI